VNKRRTRRGAFPPFSKARNFGRICSIKVWPEVSLTTINFVPASSCVPFAMSSAVFPSTSGAQYVNPNLASKTGLELFGVAVIAEIRAPSNCCNAKALLLVCVVIWISSTSSWLTPYRDRTSPFSRLKRRVAANTLAKFDWIRSGACLPPLTTETNLSFPVSVSLWRSKKSLAPKFSVRASKTLWTKPWLYPL